MPFPLGNFTPIINTSVETVHYNVSYMYAQNQAQWTVSPWLLALCIIIGIVFLFLSGMLPLSVGSDLSAAIAHLFIFLAAAGAWSVDNISSYGVTSQGQEWVLLEGHTIYSYAFLGVVMAILWIVSWLNIYRLIMDYKRITEQETPKVEVARRDDEADMKKAGEEDRRENSYEKSIPRG